MDEKIANELFEKANNSYPLNKCCAGRIYTCILLKSDELEPIFPYIFEKLKIRYEKDLNSCFNILSKILEEEYNVEIPKLDDDKYIKLSSENQKIRYYASKYDEFCLNKNNLSQKTIKEIERLNNKPYKKRRSKKIRSFVLSKENIGNTGNKVIGISLRAKLNYGKYLERLSRNICPDIETINYLINWEDLGLSDKKEIRLKEIEKEYNKYSQIIREATLNYLEKLLNSGKDFGQFNKVSNIEEIINASIINPLRFRNSIGRMILGDNGAATIIVSSNDEVEKLRNKIEELNFKKKIKIVRSKSEDLRIIKDKNNPLSYEKDGALVFNFRDFNDEGAASEIRILTGEKLLEATHGIKAHKKMSLKKKKRFNIALNQSEYLKKYISILEKFSKRSRKEFKNL